MTWQTALPVIWFFIIGFGVAMYVLLDGFVLGIGILTPFADDEHQRDLMMNTAAPMSPQYAMRRATVPMSFSGSMPKFLITFLDAPM